MVKLSVVGSFYDFENLLGECWNNIVNPASKSGSNNTGRCYIG